MIERDITTELIEAATTDFFKGIERFRKIVSEHCLKGRHVKIDETEN